MSSSSSKQKAHAAKLKRYNKALQGLPGAAKLRRDIFGEDSGGKKKKKKKAKKKAGARSSKKKASKKKKAAAANKKPKRRATHTKRGKAFAQEYGRAGWYYNNSKGKFTRWSDGSKTKRDKAKAKLKKKKKKK